MRRIGADLLAERRQREQPEELDLVLELDSVLREYPATCLGHQSDRVGSAGPVGVLDEVRVPRRDLRAADPVALQSAGLHHQAGGQLVLGILEDASESALVRGLRGLAERLELGDRCLDLSRIPRLEPELGPRHDLAPLGLRLSVREAQLARREPPRSPLVDDQRPQEDLGPVASEGPCISPNAPAHRAWDRARKLEAAEAGGAGSMEADGVRRPAACDQYVIPNLGRG